MRILLSILTVLVAIPAAGSPPLEVVELTPELAQELGFEIEVNAYKGETMMNLVGPLEIGDDCRALAGGNYVTGPNGKGVSLYFTELRESTDERPRISASIVDESRNTLGVFLDYMCPGYRALQSRRYEIQSIQAWGSGAK